MICLTTLSTDNHCTPSLVEVRLLLLQVADLKGKGETERDGWEADLSAIAISSRMVISERGCVF